MHRSIIHLGNDSLKGQTMSDTIYQIKIELNDISPPVWRRFLVKSDVLLSDLHLILQTIMGWTNSHLHHFIKENTFYIPPEEEEEWEDTSAFKNRDYTDIELSQLLTKEGEAIMYEYDFGDGWGHILGLEKIVPAEKGKFYPVCLAGERNCPPEDCGGAGGYEELLGIIHDPGNENFDDTMEWLGGEFDPEAFDINNVNALLKKEDFGSMILSD
jgi:hypothetical protein